MQDHRIMETEALVTQLTETVLNAVDEAPKDVISGLVTNLVAVSSLKLQLVMCERLEEIATLLKQEKGQD